MAQPVTIPTVPSVVPYGVRHRGNEMSKSPRTMSPRSKNRCANREASADLPASKRRGARVGGMVSTGESSASVEKTRTGQGAELPVKAAKYGNSSHCRHGYPTLTAYRRKPKPLDINPAEHGKPVWFPQKREGKPQGSTTIMRAKDRGESESLAVTSKILVATSPDTKVGRLPLGLSSRENLTKRLKEQGR